MEERWVHDGNVALLTDLYELTMAASYFERGMNGPATFELFVRRLPPGRNYLIACGVEEALDYLARFAFSTESLGGLRTLALFAEPFLDFLAGLRFTGDAWAVHEGEAIFAEEPLLSLTAPLIQAQLVETYLLNCVGFQTTVASKAARVTTACAGRPYIDFSARRDHGVDAAMRAARASYVGGAAGTSNVLAGLRYEIPLSGTMAHSYVQAFASEAEAFRAYARSFPQRCTLLIDTYDTLRGAETAAAVARELRGEGIAVQAVRLDSGDLLALSKRVRRVLDEGDCADVRIFVSGDLDEHRITQLIDEGAAIDGFGVGTHLGTSADAPTLSSVYKLVEDGRGAQMKLSDGKATLPGRKQVYRFSEAGPERDLIALRDEPAPPGGRSLLVQRMRDGRRVGPAEPLAVARERCVATLAGLPDRVRGLSAAAQPYAVSLSPALEELGATVRARRSR